MGELRPYQTDLVNRLSQSWRAGHKAPCIVLPCGGGKSVIVAEIAKRTTENGGNVLFLVHRKELCDQIRNTFRWWGVEMDLCNVMMVQTASRRVQKLTYPTLIIIDENHHSKAATYRKIYDAFPAAYRVGVTATPIRLDGSGLGDVNDDLIVGVTAKWLIQNNCLAPYDYYAPKILDTADLHTKRGEYDMAEAEQMMMSNKYIFGDVIAHYQTYAKGKKAVCYCVSIRYSQMMAKMFCDVGIPAQHLDAKTPKKERDAIIADFRSGKIQILCNVDLISEGFDVPDCGCAILLRPTQSLTLYIQQSMRCMRYQPDKRAVILDHVGNVKRFGMPDADREWSLDGRKKDDKGFQIETCTYCYYSFPKYDKNGKVVKKCPNCGEPLRAEEERPLAEPKGQEVHTEIKLEKVTDVPVIPAMPSQCKTFADLATYGKAKGYKPGWAYYMAKRMGLPVGRTKHDAGA